MTNASATRLAALIEASPGGAAATQDEMAACYRKLARFRFAAVMVPPRHVCAAADFFRSRRQPVATAIACPLGAMTTEARLMQMAQALGDGVDEVAVAMDLSAFRSGDTVKAADELRAMRLLAGDHTVKAICYSAMLPEDAMLRAAELILHAGISFVATNPGYGNVTAAAHVRAIKQRFGSDLQVMAWGGVDTRQDALAMLEAGADRIATGSPFAVMGIAEPVQESV